MDTSSSITHLGLCAGYGGIELGLHRVIRNLRTVALSEIEAFACANLVAKMEAGLMDCAPIWTDLKTFPWAEFRDRVDILTGGYPCQPFSAAGKRLGTEDPRHLWPFIADGIRILRPKLCFFENVEGHISLGLREVIGELESLGYQSSWGIFSASEVGAPHQRKRVFILAVSNSLGGAAGVSRSLAWNERIAGEFDHGSGEGGGVAITLKQGLQGCSSESLHSRRLQCEAGRSGDIAWPSRPGELVDAEHLGHNAAEIDGGHPAGADPRWAQESEVHRQSSGGCSPIWPSRPGEPQHAWEPPRVVGARMADANELRLEEHGLQHASVSFGSGRGQDAEAMGNATSERPGTLGTEPAGQQRQASITSTGDAMWNATQREDHGRESRDLGQAAGEGRCGNDAADCTGEVLADTSIVRCDGRPNGISGRIWEPGEVIEDAAGSGGQGNGMRQAQSSMGRDAHGAASGMDYAELQVSCDNRTDELRLLGNGVVPATATRAFLTLWEELFQQQPTN